MKILNRNQGGGRGFHRDNISTFEHDRKCILNEMREHFFILFMRSEGTFQKFRQRRFLPSNIRSRIRVEYDKSRNQLNKENTTQLASCFPNVTCQQVEQLFNS